MKNILFCTAVFQLALSFSVNAELAKKVPIKDLVIETSNERMPSKKNIDECMKSMCQVFITNADGIKAQQSGVLIGSKIVVTSLHAFEQEKWEGGKKPEAQYSTVRFAEYDETDFEVVQIEPQDAADDLWQSYDVCPTHIDFMILKLKDAPVAVSNGKVAIAKVAWSWGLDEYINKESMPVSTKSFILHYGVDAEENWHNNVANSTWCISFASNTEDQTWSPEYYKPWLSINVPPTIKKYEQSPWKYGWRVDYGSSGGGVFNDDGELIAIVRGFQQYTNIMSAVPIDYVADNKYGSSTAKSLFNSDGLQTIPGYYFDEIFQIWPYSYTNTPDNNTIPPVHNQPGREIYLSSSSDAFPATQLLPNGSQMGQYELSIYALGSTVDAFTYLNSYSSDVFGTLSLTGSKNKFSDKSTITGQDLVKDENGNERFNVKFTQNSQGNVFATKVIINLEIRDVNDCKLSINGAPVLDNSKINGISIHGLELKYTGAINDGFKVKGSSGSGSTGSYANKVVALHGSYAPAVYLLANDGCTYSLSGQCVDCNVGCPEFETVFRDIRNVGFLGKVHSNTDDGYKIEWDDGSTSSKSGADYQYLSKGKINEHQYKRAGEYTVKVKWKEWNFLWLGKHDESKTLASIVVPPLEAEERIAKSSYTTYRGYRQQYPPVGLVKIGISTLGLYVDRTEVTQGEYARITEKHPFNNFGKYTANYPAENITFYDAIIFCNEKSTEEGYEPVYSYDNPVYSQGNANCISLSNLTADYNKNGYRIPTQQEWTEAYFANSENTTTYWALRNAPEYAWYTVNSNQKSQPVGHKTPNGANLFDMAGNVSEFIWNGIDSDGKPIGACAGGNFRSAIDGLNGSSSFLNIDENAAYDDVGLRCVRNAPNPVTIDFTASEPQGAAPFDVSFTPIVHSGTVQKWIWDFGDGWVSEDPNPTHTYNSIGSYQVTLTAVGSIENQVTQLTKTAFVNVTEYVPPVAVMDVSTFEGDVPFTVQFSGDNQGGPLGENPWFWSFGDGATSNLQNPQHTYTQRGFYPVELSVTGEGGDVSNVDGFYLQALEPAPQIQIAASKMEGISPLTVNFEGINTGGYVSENDWNWDFGNDEYAAGRIVEHRYRKPGQYTVKLRANGPDYYDEKEISIKVKPDITPIINLLLLD